MIVKYLLLGFCTVALAQASVYEVLKHLKDHGLVRLQEVAQKLRDPTDEYTELTEERLQALLWEHEVQYRNMKESVEAAISKGMLRNNQFANFECISKGAVDTYAKINESMGNTFSTMTLFVKKNVEKVQTYGLIMPGFTAFVGEYYTTQYENMKKAHGEAARWQILEAVEKKMKFLESILTKLEDKVKELKFKFFEDYVKYVFDSENYVKRVAREGAQKVFKCVA